MGARARGLRAEEAPPPRDERSPALWWNGCGELLLVFPTSAAAPLLVLFGLLLLLLAAAEGEGASTAVVPWRIACTYAAWPSASRRRSSSHCDRSRRNASLALRTAL